MPSTPSLACRPSARRRGGTARVPCPLVLRRRILCGFGVKVVFVRLAATWPKPGSKLLRALGTARMPLRVVTLSEHGRHAGMKTHQVSSAQPRQPQCLHGSAQPEGAYTLRAPQEFAAEPAGCRPRATWPGAPRPSRLPKGRWSIASPSCRPATCRARTSFGLARGSASAASTVAVCSAFLIARAALNACSVLAFRSSHTLRPLPGGWCTTRPAGQEG